MSERSNVSRWRRHRSLRSWIGASSALILLVLIAVVIGVAMHRAGQPQSAALSVGAPAPDGSYTPINGATTSVAALRGQPALVWFVSTSCDSCEAGTKAMANQIDQFAQHHVRVVELELYDNLGAGATDIGAFGRALAGARFSHPDWTWGNASQTLTTAFDPKNYLDVYYLLDAHGTIRYYNSAPESTMTSLLAHLNTIPS